MLSQFQRSSSNFGMREFTHSISSLQQCQSRVETGRMESGIRNKQRQEINVGDEQQIMQKWIAKYEGHKINKNRIKRLKDYYVSNKDSHICKLSIKQLKNIEIDSRMLAKAGPLKYQDFYFQFAVQFLDKQSNSLVSKYQTYLSQCHRLDQSARQRYEYSQQIELYFSFPFQSVILMKIDFFLLLSSKQRSQFSRNQKQVSIITDRQLMGTIFIDGSQKGEYEYLLSEQTMDDHPMGHSSRNNKQMNKGDQTVRISLSDLQKGKTDLLHQMMTPLKLYSQQSSLGNKKGLKLCKILKGSIPRQIQNRLNISLEIESLSINQSSISSANKKFQSILKMKYGTISKIQSLQVKEYRLVVFTHNGQKVTSSNSLLLMIKKDSEASKSKRKNTDSSESKNKRFSHYASPKNAVNQRNNNFQSKILLFSQSLAQLNILPLSQNTLIITQLFCKIEAKVIIQDQSRPISESFMFPLSYLVKSIETLNNDTKYEQKMFFGEILAPNGIQKYKEQLLSRKQNQKRSNRLESKKNLQSLNKIRQKAETMSECMIEFYVFVQKQSDGQKSQVRLMTESDNLSQSFFGQKQGRQMNKLIMQKARLKRQRQKVQQKINQYNLENNNNIPLLDTTEIKMQYYKQNISQIKQEQFELKSTLNFLKDQIQQFELKNRKNQQMQNQLIEDTLGLLKNQKGINIVGQRLIGAQGGIKYNKPTNEDNSSEVVDKNKNRAVIPYNYQPIDFSLNLKNISYLIAELKEIKTLLIEVKSIKMFNGSNSIRFVDIFGGLQSFGKLIEGVQLSQNPKEQNNKLMQIAIQVPKFTPNLLLFFLFAPLTLYIVDHSTGVLIGKIFVYFSNLLSLIVRNKKQQSMHYKQMIQVDKNYVPILKINEVKGSINLRIELNKKLLKQLSPNQSSIPSSPSAISKSVISEVQELLSLSEMSEQKRKIMRIDKLKRMAIKNNQKQNNQQGNSSSSLMTNQNFKGTSKQQFTIQYHPMTYKFVKVTLKNPTSAVKSFKLSINDPDSKYFVQNDPNQPNQILSSSQQLICANTNPLGQSQKIFVPDQQGNFQIPPNSEGIILFQYFSKRDIFPASLRKVQINEINLQNSIQKDFFRKYNHKRDITSTITSQSGVEKIINISINPVLDSNSVDFSYYFPFEQQFLLPLPFCSLITKNNIYFSHEQIQLVEIDGQWNLCGYAPQLSKVTILSVYVYPQPSILGSLGQQLQNKNIGIDSETNQMITNIVYSQKALHLSFKIRGCLKVNTFNIRLFEQTDILWELDKEYLISKIKNIKNSSNDLCYICLSSSKPQILGFRSNSHQKKIKGQTTIAINLQQKQSQTFIKSVIIQKLCQYQQILIEFYEKSNPEIILCRYIIGVNAKQPYTEDKFIFKLQKENISKAFKQIISGQSNREVEQQKIQTSFLIDIRAFINENSPIKNFEEFINQIQKTIKYSCSKNYLKFVEIKQQTDEKLIKDYIQKHQKQQKKRVNEIRKSLTNNDIKSKKKLVSKKQIPQLSFPTYQPFIARIALELDLAEFYLNLSPQQLSSLENSFSSKNSYSKNRLHEQEQNQSNFINKNIIFGLSSTEKILYFSIQLTL